MICKFFGHVPPPFILFAFAAGQLELSVCGLPRALSCVLYLAFQVPFPQRGHKAEGL